MLTLAKAGAVVLPASPGFYHAPKKIDDLVDHIVGRIMDALHIEHRLYKRWAGLP
jgi:4-hydroxy-3-polyprenylbenzoate decarboxylase